jgi:Radical SAM superfamily
MESREARRSSAVHRLDSLVFNLNFRCDKRCSMCCVKATPSPRAADLPLGTIAAVARRIAEAGIEVDAIGLSGGEPFLYGGADDGAHSLADVIGVLCEASPRVIYIQTSGVGPMVRDFDRQLDEVFAAARGLAIEVESSYTSYQIPGIDERMAATIDAVLAHQDRFRIYLTSDPDNARQTLLGFRGLLASMGFTRQPPTRGADRATGTAPAADGDGDGARHLFRFARGSQQVIGRLALTLPVGRARRLGLRSPAPATQFRDGCRWLNGASLVVHPDGALGFCCMPTSLPSPASRYHLSDGDLPVVLARHRALAQDIALRWEQIRDTPDPPLLCSLCNGVLGNAGVA